MKRISAAFIALALCASDADFVLLNAVDGTSFHRARVTDGERFAAKPRGGFWTK